MSDRYIIVVDGLSWTDVVEYHDDLDTAIKALHARNKRETYKHYLYEYKEVE